MEFTDNPLEYQVSDRGLAYMQAIETRDGASIAVHDSSAAEHDALWFEFKPTLEQSTLDGAYSIGMDITDALTLAQQIIVLAERRGIRPDGAVTVDPVLDEYTDTAAALNTNADAPDRETGPISDIDGIIELGAFLATVHTAAALAEDIPRRIADLDITAFTQDIGDHLRWSAEAAQRRIRDIALGNDEDDQAPKAFPPRPYHLNTAGDSLELLRLRALAVAARAGAVRAEIDCYLDTSTNPAEDGPNPECSCPDGNCDDCKRNRANTESE